MGIVLGRYALAEAWQQRLLPILSLAGGLLLGLALVLRGLDFGDAELTFLADFVYGLIYLLGTVAALWLPIRGLETLRTSGQLSLWLTQPVHRSDLIAGLLLGYALVVLTWAAMATAAGTLLLAWRATELGQPFQLLDFALGGLIQGLRLTVVVSMAVAASAFFRTATLAGFMSVFLVAIAQLQHRAVDLWSRPESGWTQLPAGALAAIFPNFRLFELPTAPLLTEGYPAAFLASTAGYGLLYVGLYGALAAGLFATRRHEEDER